MAVVLWDPDGYPGGISQGVFKYQYTPDNPTTPYDAVRDLYGKLEHVELEYFL